MRMWVSPDTLAKLGVTVTDERTLSHNVFASIRNAAGQTSGTEDMKSYRKDLKLNDILVADLAAAEAATAGNAPKASSPDSPSNPTSTAAP